MRCQKCGQDNPPEARYCAACGAPLASPASPAAASWVPGVISSYGNGWRKLWPKFLELFLILLIYFAIGLINVVPVLYSIFVDLPVGYGVAFAYLKAARGEKVQVKDMFDSFNNYLNAVLAGFLVMVIVLVGLVLLVIPGIYFACKLAFTPYLVVDRKMEGIAAIKESWRMTGGHIWEVFLIGLMAIPIAIAGLICLGVGFIPAVMWIYLAFASLYHAVSTSGGTAAPQKTGPSV